MKVCTFTASWCDGVKSRVEHFISNLSGAKPGSRASALYCAIIMEERESTMCLGPKSTTSPENDEDVRCLCFSWQWLQAGDENKGQHHRPEALLGRWVPPVFLPGSAGTQSHRHHRGTQRVTTHLGVSQTTSFRADTVYTSWAAGWDMSKKYINPQQFLFRSPALHSSQYFVDTTKTIFE